MHVSYLLLQLALKGQPAFECAGSSSNVYPVSDLYLKSVPCMPVKIKRDLSNDIISKINCVKIHNYTTNV